MNCFNKAVKRERERDMCPPWLTDNPSYSQKYLKFFHIVLISAFLPRQKRSLRSGGVNSQLGKGALCSSQGPTLWCWDTPSQDWVGGRTYRSGLSPSSIRLVTTGFLVIWVRLKGVVGFSCAARGLWATTAKKRAM